MLNDVKRNQKERRKYIKSINLNNIKYEKIGKVGIF